MPLISSTIPNLINGVSQQPPPTRIPTACEAATNCYMSVVSGLQKRQNSEFVSKITTTQPLGSAATHLKKDSRGKRYVFVGTSGRLRAFDLDTGTETPVTNAAGLVTSTVGGETSVDYLASTNPAHDFGFVTVADQTFVLNRSITARSAAVAETASRKDPSNTVSVFIKRAVAKTNYVIKIGDTVVAQTQTKDNTTADTALEGTAEIAQNLADSFNTLRSGLGAVINTSVSAKRIGSLITFQRAAPGANQTSTPIKVDDQFGGAAMRVIEDTVQDFSDLPPAEEKGRLVKVVGDAEAEGDDYWVEFDGKVWVEAVEYGKRRRITPSSMPHKLVLKVAGDGTSSFELTDVEWGERIVGDENTNENPTFVNNRINSMFLYKGRMGFLTDENLVMSEVSDYENFYRTTVTQLIDTDRIDVASTTGSVNILRHAVAFGSSLVLFSDTQQFKVTQGDILSPSTVGLQPTTAYDGAQNVSPVNSGPNVFFAVDGPRFSIVREMYIDENNGDQFDAAEVTIQVPKFIPAPVRAMAVSTYEDALILSAGDQENCLYIYKWFLDGKSKVQSSWSKWEFDPETKIKGIGFLDQDLIMVYEIGTDLQVDRVRLEEAVALSDENILLLDHQVSTDTTGWSATYDATTDRTTFVLPFSHPGEFEFWTTCRPYGLQIPTSRGRDPANPIAVGTATNTYTAPGNWATHPLDTPDLPVDANGNKVTTFHVTAGLPYSFDFTFSDQFVRTNRGSGDISVQDGRLQLRYMSVVYQNSSYFEVEVKPKNRDARRHVFNARTLADGSNVFGSVPIETGEFRFPVFAQNTKVRIRLLSRKPFPCAFGVVEWDALYNPRTTRI